MEALWKIPDESDIIDRLSRLIAAIRKREIEALATEPDSQARAHLNEELRLLRNLCLNIWAQIPYSPRISMFALSQARDKGVSVPWDSGKTA